MMFEIRSPRKVVAVERANCSAMVSPTSFESAYEDSGRAGCSSSMGANAGGVSNGKPSTVSLEAHTTRPTPRSVAAEKTLYVEIALFRNVSPGGCRPDDGIAARWTTTSAPATTSWH